MITKLTMREFRVAVKRWMERHPEVQPMRPTALFQCVVEDCYPNEDYATLMKVVAETEAAAGIESSIRAHQSDPDHWEPCGVNAEQGELFAGDEVRSPRRYVMPDGRIANRGQVSIPFGLELKNSVKKGLLKKLEAVQLAIDLDARVIDKARAHNIDPETVTYAPHEEQSDAAHKTA